MEKYPSIYSVGEFRRVVEKVPELLDLEGYIEPKYDGSNITMLDGVARTRNLNPLPPNFMEGLRAALGEKYSALVALSKTYQVFLELGGTRNAPAGYRRCWSREWDYVVFDLMRGGSFVQPFEAKEIVEGYGLRFVDVRTIRVNYVISDWARILNEYKIFEGFVLKIFPPPSILRKIPHHRQKNVVIAKFKHEYKGEQKPVKKPKSASKRAGTRKSVEKDILPRSEIMGAINKAHLLLGNEIYNKNIAMPVIFKLVREEAEKHGYRVPKASLVYRLYQEYLSNLGDA